MTITENTKEIIIAMIENNKILSVEEILSAFDKIYKKIYILENQTSESLIKDYNDLV